MDDTAELRWVGSGPVSPSLAEWFGGTPSPDRIDHYAAPAAAAGLGVKVRAGTALEFKALHEAVGVWSFGEGATGRVETWRKWAFPLSSAEAEESLGEGWLRVEKRRRLRRFAVDIDAAGRPTVHEIMAPDVPGLGCDAELTDLIVRGASWWTLAFEAFGEEHRLDALRAVTALVLNPHPAELSLSASRSMAYPAWLASLDRRPAGG